MGWSLFASGHLFSLSIVLIRIILVQVSYQFIKEVKHRIYKEINKRNVVYGLVSHLIDLFFGLLFLFIKVFELCLHAQINGPFYALHTNDESTANGLFDVCSLEWPQRVVMMMK